MVAGKCEDRRPHWWRTTGHMKYVFFCTGKAGRKPCENLPTGSAITCELWKPGMTRSAMGRSTRIAQWQRARSGRIRKGALVAGAWTQRSKRSGKRFRDAGQTFKQRAYSLSGMKKHAWPRASDPWRRSRRSAFRVYPVETGQNLLQSGYSGAAALRREEKIPG